MAAIGKSDLLTPEGHRGHPGITSFETADEIAYAESNDAKLISIGSVDAEL